LGEQLEGHQRVARVAFVPPRVREPLVGNRFGDLAAVAIPEAFVFDVELKLEADFRSEFTEVERPLLDVFLVGQAFQTRETGASKVRSTTSGSSFVTSLGFAAIFLLLASNFLRLVLALQSLR